MAEGAGGDAAFENDCALSCESVSSVSWPPGVLTLITSIEPLPTPPSAKLLPLDAAAAAAAAAIVANFGLFINLQLKKGEGVKGKRETSQSEKQP